MSFTRRKTELERFMSHVQIDSHSGCWLWTGYRAGGRYGRFGVGYRIEHNVRMECAHRVSWRLFRGRIQEGVKVLHKCDVPHCVNADHLFLGSQADNLADMARKNRGTKSRQGLPYGVQRCNLPGMVKKYYASIQIDGRKEYLGSFMTINEAAAAAITAKAALL